MTQAAVSQLEQRTDVYLSTLENFVEAMGGRLEMGYFGQLFDSAIFHPCLPILSASIQRSANSQNDSR